MMKIRNSNLSQSVFITMYINQKKILLIVNYLFQKIRIGSKRKKYRRIKIKIKRKIKKLRIYKMKFQAK